MKSLVVSMVLALAGGSACAQDMTAPVRQLIEIAAGNWAVTDPTEDEVFGEEQLARLFSTGFAADYRAAALHPAYDLPEGETSGYPFDYDPIAQGQDGCAFENIRIVDEGDGAVTARFQNHLCFGDTADDKADTVLVFSVTEEGGHPVIDDFRPERDGENGGSIRQELREIAAQ
ncbi:hypothetical protein [Rhizobium halophytocola]|uniref:DUF3617 family protein n=1 Tax=Rhizobium halophytocola TaxID=735519 RepID=A0ABS4DZ90_9HYPH|nr:hypothetical protein [Rhizobium halophytocola]MBP1851010.1 hypothetical protein [Rhizobium halophytocola]